jgi:hypothetical protein
MMVIQLLSYRPGLRVELILDGLTDKYFAAATGSPAEH